MVGDMSSEDDNFFSDDTTSWKSSSYGLGVVGESSSGGATQLVFRTFEDGYLYYQEYARVVGFDTRKQAAKKCPVDSMYKWRYACCNRQGLKFADEDYEESKVDDSHSLNTSRRRSSTRCGCPAKACFRFEGTLGWVIYKFVEQHNHGFVGKEHQSYMKVNRNVDDMHKRFIIDCAKVNIGTTDAYHFISEICGGKDQIGCTLLDMRNFVRDLRAYVKDSDAQMLLNELKHQKELNEIFFTRTTSMWRADLRG